MRRKRLVVVSDLHCGHIYGLTPSKWQYNDLDNPLLVGLKDVQKEIWKFYSTTLKKLQPVDFCLVNGDCVDGEGKKETIELHQPDVHNQIMMAVECLKEVKAKKYLMTFGTPYHVVNNLHYEKQIADILGNSIEYEQNFSIYGKKINAKHHTSKSSIPHGGGTLVLKRALWGLIKSALQKEEPADIIIRSHIHERIIIKSNLPIAITTPALQAANTMYGSRFDGWYDIGLMHIDINEKGEIETIQDHILRVKSQKKETLKLC